MTAYPILVAVALNGLVTALVGAVLLARRRAAVAAAFLLLGGVTLLVATVAARNGPPRLAASLLTLGGALLLPLAVATFPRWGWRRPTDFLALVTIAGSGTYLTVQPTDPAVQTPMYLTIGMVLAAHLWWRIERADAAARRSLAWVALAIGVAGLLCGVLAFVSDGSSTTTGTAVVATGIGLLVAIPISMYIGVTDPDLVDVRGLVVRAVVLAVALTFYVSLFVGAASFLEILGGRVPRIGALGIVAALIALTMHPLQVVLRGVVDELLFGRRPDPLDAASRVIGGIGGGVGADPTDALRTIKDAMVLPFVALHVDGTEVAAVGTPVTHTRRLPMSVGEAPGVLEVGLRPGDLTLSAGDEHILALVRPLLAQTMHAQSLAEQLQASREATVSALAEERRRLRRDLHDGLGPRLSGIAFTSDAVRNVLRDRPQDAEALLDNLRHETVTAIAEIRELVYAMRPPALDELGLVGAIRQQALTLRTASGRALAVELSAEVPRLPAAVEVAAYRIVVEALTNVARHGGSDRAQVRLQVDGEQVTLDVLDDGVATDWPVGVGLSSMRERAAELGGRLWAGHADGHGRVHATLPIGAVPQIAP